MQGSLIYTSNLCVFPYKTCGKEADDKSPEWAPDFMAVQPSKMVRQNTWHNVWNSMLLAICLNYRSSCIVRKGAAVDSLNLHNHKEKLPQKVFMWLSLWPLHHSFISQRQNISRGTHMKMCVRWRMSTVITCGSDIRQVLLCDAFVQQQFVLVCRCHTRLTVCSR